MHEGEANFACEICDYKTYHFEVLQRHLTSSKLSGKVFKCEICEQRFCTKTLHLIHMKNHRKEKEILDKCDICDITFSNYSNMLRHMKNSTRHRSENDQQTHKNKQTKCQSCDMKFANKDNFRKHLRRALSMKPTKCKKCGLKSCTLLVRHQCKDFDGQDSIALNIINNDEVKKPKVYNFFPKPKRGKWVVAIERI